MNYYSILQYTLLVYLLASDRKATANQCTPSLVNLQYSRHRTLKCQQNPTEQVIRGWGASRNAQWEIENDGREIVIKPNPENSLWMTFRRSKTKHFVDYIQLKWGKNNNQGSDHALNHVFQAGELQVFFKHQPGIQKSHVFSFMIEQRGFMPNTEWNPLLKSILRVKNPGKKTMVPAPRSGVRALLKDSLPGAIHTSRYIEQSSCRYTRLFRDRDCSERKMIWTVFPRPIELSFSQLFQLRMRIKYNQTNQEAENSTFEPTHENLCFINA